MKALAAFAVCALFALPSLAQDPPATVSAQAQAEAELEKAKAELAKAEAALAAAKAAQVKAEAALAEAKPEGAANPLGQHPLLSRPTTFGGFCGQAQVEAWMLMNTDIGRELRRKQQEQIERMMQSRNMAPTGMAPAVEKVAPGVEKPVEAPPEAGVK